MPNFLKHDYPTSFNIVKAEILDFQDRRSGESDLVIYDASRNAPIRSGSDAVLIPCEALLALIEVKSKLNLEGMKSCYQAATQIRKQSPYKSQRWGKALANSGGSQPRYFHTVIAFESNLGSEDWHLKEWERIKTASAFVGAEVDFIDRILVLDRGLIMPPFKMANTLGSGGANALHDWFVSLANFLARENPRRAPVDWEMYAGRQTKSGWKKLP